MSTTALDKTPYVYSASQIKTYVLCPRKWYWEYPMGIKAPSGPAAELGTRVHRVLERWFREGIPPNRHTAEGKIATVGLEYLPLPGPFLEVERYIHFQVGDFQYRGYVDLGFTADDGPWVVDHKTTGDFGWALGPDDLLHDVQALLYAKESLDRHQVDELTLMWLYYRTRGKAIAQPTICTVTRPQVESGFRLIESTVAEIDKIRLTVIDDPMSVTPNPQACEAFGGCPHIKRCGMTAKQRIKAIMAQAGKREGLASRMRARSQSTDGDAAPARPVAKPGMNPPESPSDEEALSTTPAEPAGDGKKAAKKAAKKKAAKKVTSSKGKGGKGKGGKGKRNPLAAARNKDKDEPKDEAAAEPEDETAAEPEDETSPAANSEPASDAESEAASEEEPEPKPKPKPKPRKPKAPAVAVGPFTVGDKKTAFVLLHMAALMGGGGSDRIQEAAQAFSTFEGLYGDD